MLLLRFFFSVKAEQIFANSHRKNTRIIKKIMILKANIHVSFRSVYTPWFVLLCRLFRGRNLLLSVGQKLKHTKNIFALPKKPRA